MTRILVVDDEPQLARAVVINLRANGYETEAAADGRTALRMAADSHPDAVILDLGLPDISGIDVLHGIRGWSSMPVVILSARDDEDGKIAALDAGADDYVTKPFSMAELLARLRATTRRAGATEENAVLHTAAFTIDFAARSVRTPGGEVVRLTPTEWRLLESLARHPGRLMTQRQLLTEVWGPEFSAEAQYLRVYMGQLRRKLEPDTARPRHLITEPGVGYRFEK